MMLISFIRQVQARLKLGLQGLTAVEQTVDVLPEHSSCHTCSAPSAIRRHMQQAPGPCEVQLEDEAMQASIDQMLRSI